MNDLELGIVKAPVETTAPKTETGSGEGDGDGLGEGDGVGEGLGDGLDFGLGEGAGAGATLATLTEYFALDESQVIQPFSKLAR